MHRPALHQFGVPVNQDAALHVGAADQPGTVDAAAGFSTPAVLRAEVFFCLFHELVPERRFAPAVPAVQRGLHQCFRLAALGQRQRFVEAAARFLREYRRHRIAHRFQCHVPDIAGRPVHELDLRPAVVRFGFLQPAEHRAAFQLQQPDALHLRQTEHIGGAARHDQLRAEIGPQVGFLHKIEVRLEHIAVIAVKSDHFSHPVRELLPFCSHAAGCGAHLTDLSIQALVPDGGDDARFAFLRGRRQVVDGHDRPCKECKFHPSGTSNSSSSSSGFIDKMAPSALPVTVSAIDCLACCNSMIFSSMVSCAMSLYTCTGFCWPMR